MKEVEVVEVVEVEVEVEEVEEEVQPRRSHKLLGAAAAPLYQKGRLCA